MNQFNLHQMENVRILAKLFKCFKYSLCGVKYEIIRCTSNEPFIKITLTFELIQHISVSIRPLGGHCVLMPL